MVRDKIGDFITALKNGNRAKKESVLFPYSNLVMSVGGLLAKAGFVARAEKRGKKMSKFVEVVLIYRENGAPRIADVKRISKLSRRIYRVVKEIYPVRNGTGALVLSTTKGIMTGAEARRANIGGEVLFEIW